MPKDAQDTLPDTTAPTHDDSLTPDPGVINVSENATVSFNPNVERLSIAESAGRFPIEPKVKLLKHKSPDESLRETTMFAIISRLLMKNKQNTDILASLNEGGFPMSVRTLQRLMGRSDFIDYYTAYRANILEPVDKLIREDFKLAMPEAFTQVVRLMRNAKSEKVRGDMAITILEGGGGLKKVRRTETIDIQVPPDVAKALLEAGSRLATPGPGSLVGPSTPYPISTPSGEPQNDDDLVETEPSESSDEKSS